MPFLLPFPNYQTGVSLELPLAAGPAAQLVKFITFLVKNNVPCCCPKGMPFHGSPNNFFLIFPRYLKNHVSRVQSQKLVALPFTGCFFHPKRIFISKVAHFY